MNRPPRNHKPSEPPSGTAPERRSWAAAYGTAALIFLVLAAGSAVSPLSTVRAAEKKTLTFLGVKVKPHKGEYVVMKDVNVRAKPKTKSKKI